MKYKWHLEVNQGLKWETLHFVAYYKIILMKLYISTLS
jgi:hypothetical protein